jgi:hypothetical protein
MRYRHIQPATSQRFRLPATRPVFAQIEIDEADWHRFEQLAEDNQDTEIIGHDAAPRGRITVYVACNDGDTRQKLDDGWA